MRDSILELIERAMAGTEKLPAASRADLYDAAAALLSGASADLMLAQTAVAASQAAQALREAEARQLTFASLLRHS